MTDKEFRELLETTIKATGVQKKAELDQSIEEAYALV
jgi:hypothetical protein